MSKGSRRTVLSLPFSSSFWKEKGSERTVPMLVRPEGMTAPEGE